MTSRGGDRPTDAERARFLAIVDAARGRPGVDDNEWVRRRRRITRATTRAELSGVVADLPRSPSVRAAAVKGWLITLAASVAVGLAAGGVLASPLASGPDSAVRAGPAEAADDAPAPADSDQAAGAVGMYSPGMLEALFSELAVEGVDEYVGVDLYPDRARFEVPAAPGAAQYDVIEFRDGSFTEREPGGEITSADTPQDAVFSASDLTEGVVTATAAAAADVAGLQGRPVSLVSVGRSSAYGAIVTISVHLEPDDYGDGAFVEWDSTGQHLLRDGR
ncbi:DUF1707 domain-containing protein [Phytoactinopolyspora halotolerans]|uniref:DUF1707 domain-containing protein n=1 Tax=Phytoactinopolyspora halotolerans TaxID=1981512 RepID=A0A6L9S569_9ACTN|nr:DUF1707 domain-containing protein [Phytoactinopolyspora halotolerans]NEE00306.1 DUF1707 domain-containing protein [Phytoactinopolyspora halotolerans]